MKRLLTLVLSIAVLASLGGLASAEPNAVKSSKSNTSERAAADTPSPTATPNAKKIPEGTPIVVPEKTVKGSKSNSDNRAKTGYVFHGGVGRQSATVKSSKSNTSDRLAPHVNRTFTGKVSQVDPKTNTFTLTAKGKQYKFTIVKDKSNKSQLPKVGAVVEVPYTGTLGGAQPAQATTVISSRNQND